MSDIEHPFMKYSNNFYMNPSFLKSIGVKIDEICVVCGKDQSKKDYYIDEGLIHCISCALKHGHITEEEAKEHE